IKTLFQKDPEIKTRPGIFSLKKAKLLNPKNFKDLIADANSVVTTSEILGFIADTDLVTQSNFDKLLKHKANKWLIYQGLRTLNVENSEILLWKGSAKLSPLINRIDQMFYYGLFLLSHDARKGKASILLALELKSLLKNFYKLSLEKQMTKKDKFSSEFLTIL